ncbi:hypothetical protein [Bdellovibrio sp. HCB337]|uniref:hypothetical protein n=1 Tax=Bdellovibrio sp. HCB337 TaxID=3394358 RepID=UPI0039A40330
MRLLAKSGLALLTVTFASMIAEATPALGDKSEYDVTLAKGGQSMSGTVVFELTNYNKATNSWTQTSTTDFNGQKQTQTETIEAKDLLDDATIDTILGNCAARGGKEETVNSPAGDFASCAVPVTNTDGTGTVWVSKVPFGFSKWVANRKDGITVTGVLKSFQNGTAPTN